MNHYLRFLRKYLSIISSLVLLIFALLGLLLGSMPAIKTTLSRFGEVSTFSDQLILMRQKAAVLSSQDEAVLRENLSLLLSAVPAEQSLPTIFATVEGIAAQSGIAIADMTISQGVTIATGSAIKTSRDKQLEAQVVPFTVSISGSFSQIKQFFELASSARRILRIKNFSLGGRSGEIKTTTVNAEAIYEPLPTAIGTVSQAIIPLSEKEEGVIAQVKELKAVLMAETILPSLQLGPVKTNPFSP